MYDKYVRPRLEFHLVYTTGPPRDRSSSCYRVLFFTLPVAGSAEDREFGRNRTPVCYGAT